MRFNMVASHTSAEGYLLYHRRGGMPHHAELFCVAQVSAFSGGTAADITTAAGHPLILLF